jgi:hypothetical protein
VIDQVGAHRRHVGDHVDAVLAQVVGGADAGQHEQLGRAEGARGEDHLGAGPDGLLNAVGAIGHPGRPAALDDQAAGERVGDDLEVGRLGGQVGVVNALPTAVDLGHLVEADAFLLGSVEVIVRLGAAPDGRHDELLGLRGFMAQVGDLEGAAGAVVWARALFRADVVLGAQEVRQQFLVTPARAAVLVAPGVVVGAVAAQVGHRADRRGAAEHLAARPVDRAGVRALLRQGDVVPVVLAAEEPAVGGRDLELLDVAGVGACL